MFFSYTSQVNRLKKLKQTFDQKRSEQERAKARKEVGESLAAMQRRAREAVDKAEQGEVDFAHAEQHLISQLNIWTRQVTELKDKSAAGAGAPPNVGGGGGGAKTGVLPLKTAEGLSFEKMLPRAISYVENVLKPRLIQTKREQDTQLRQAELKEFKEVEC